MVIRTLTTQHSSHRQESHWSLSPAEWPHLLPVKICHQDTQHHPRLTPPQAPALMRCPTKSHSTGARQEKTVARQIQQLITPL